MAYGPERGLAAAAHLAVLLSWPGLVVSVALYAIGHARRMAFVADQGGQAAAYQAAVAGAFLLFGMLGLGTVFGGVPLGALHLAAMAYGAFGAFAALDGRRFRYVRGR